MAITLPDARQLDDNVLEAIRLRALRGCELGISQTEIAAMLGVSRETVCRWWTAYANGGIDAIPGDRTGRPVGSGQALSDEQAKHIQKLLDAHMPEDLGIAAALWTRKAVRDLIRKECDVDMPERTVGAYLRRWGYTAKAPRRHARDQDPEEVAEWLNTTYPEIQRRAAREGAEIHWCDETGAAADQPTRRGYARVGKPARVEVPGPHIRASMIAAISNEGDIHFMTYTGSMTAARFVTFLERLLRETRGKVFLIVDRLRAHEAKSVAAWVAERGGRIELFWLPRYSPELNAEEYLNNDLKGWLGAANLPRCREELLSRIERFMGALRNLPERVRSYFRHPCASYAAGY